MTTNDIHRQKNAGTLLWVGNRQLSEFQPAFDYCARHASQIAIRSNVDDALRFAVDQVIGIILARENRTPIDQSSVDELIARSAPATAVQLIGPLCAGDRQNTLQIPRVYWHQWHDTVRDLLTPCGRIQPPQQVDQVKSVAVVTETYSSAEPLMDLATSASAAAVWCRRADAVRVRNFDVVWWDDSIAKPANEVEWRERLAVMRRHSRSSPSHVWLATAPHRDAVRSARAAGVDAVINKPFRVESLLATLRADDAQQAVFENATARAA